MRRDYTKQYGYICPTENSAVYFADRKPQPSRPKHSGVLREGALKQMDEGRDTPEPIRSGRPCKTSHGAGYGQRTENPLPLDMGSVKGKGQRFFVNRILRHK